ncbi:MAG: 5'-methylthioadenosine/S-adenosylhomocysteine nucleosidase [Nostoc sp.]|uniref:5'-methylthioadenosine/S-adenosylhomocysteine nucleosidase family protein n=1 Tax=Nostoc sp. TaxID=1180 RepID=UPI002FF63D40
MIERSITINNLCNLLKTDYVALLGQRKSGMKSLINYLVNNTSAFARMEFISVALPLNRKINLGDFLEMFLRRLIEASVLVSPKVSLQNEVKQVVQGYTGSSIENRLDEVLSTLGRGTTAKYLVIVLHDISEVSEEPLTSLLWLLRDYHRQINNPGQAGAKLRFLVAGNERLWKLCVNSVSNISPFNIAKRVFLGGLHYKEINDYPDANVNSFEQAIKLRDLTDGVPSIIENVINLPTKFSDLKLCFGSIQDNWNYLSLYAKETLKNLAEGTEKIPLCKPDSQCLQIPNSEYINPVWVEAFWVGFLKMRCGELAWRSPIHQAFVMALIQKMDKVSKSDLIKANVLERVERLDIAIKNTHNPELCDDLLEELLILVAHADNSDIIPVLESLQNREPDNIILANIEEVAEKYSKEWIQELKDKLERNQDNISKVVVLEVMNVVQQKIVNNDSEVNINAPERENTPIISINHAESAGFDCSPEDFESWMKTQRWYPKQFPDYKVVSPQEGKLVQQEIDIVIITATDNELDAVARLLRPYPSKTEGRKKILQISYDEETYYLGKFGEYKTVLTQCEIGTRSSGSAPFATLASLQLWYPKAIIMVGIAFGKTSIKQKIGDVLVASGIIDYDSQRVEQEKVIYRGDITKSNITLLNRFKNAKRWSFYRPDNSLCERYYCPILSGDKLIDNLEFKENLFQQFPQAGGGEMEGVAVYASAARMKTPCILVKSICDWADGNKQDIYQKFAAASAVSLVYEVLSNKHALESLEKPKKPIFE